MELTEKIRSLLFIKKDEKRVGFFADPTVIIYYFGTYMSTIFNKDNIILLNINNENGANSYGIAD